MRDCLSSGYESDVESTSASWGPTRHSRRRRDRTQFSPQALQLLETVFCTDSYPDIFVREALAERLSVTEDRIQVWFQNRRSKRKKNRSSAVPPLAGNVPDHMASLLRVSPWWHHQASVSGSPLASAMGNQPLYPSTRVNMPTQPQTLSRYPLRVMDPSVPAQSTYNSWPLPYATSSVVGAPLVPRADGLIHEVTSTRREIAQGQENDQRVTNVRGQLRYRPESSTTSTGAPKFTPIRPWEETETTSNARGCQPGQSCPDRTLKASLITSDSRVPDMSSRNAGSPGRVTCTQPSHTPRLTSGYVLNLLSRGPAFQVYAEPESRSVLTLAPSEI